MSRQWQRVPCSRTLWWPWQRLTLWSLGYRKVSVSTNPPWHHGADDPLSFPHCGGLITLGMFVYQQFSVLYDPAGEHSSVRHLRWTQTGGDRGEGFGVGGRHWPCAIMRGANTHRWQSLDHGLAVAITLALLSWIRCVPVKQTHNTPLWKALESWVSVYHSLSYCHTAYLSQLIHKYP